jgi:hypothetical protein
MGKWSGVAWFVPRCRLMAAMQIRQEPIRPQVRRQSLPGAKGQNSGALISVKTAFCGARKLTCDKASPERAVMLHLRARYVSKAAILTVPAPRVPVENRSPA